MSVRSGSSSARTAVLAAILGACLACLAACSGGATPAPEQAAKASATASATAEAPQAGEAEDTAGTTDPEATDPEATDPADGAGRPGPEKVRDAFAGLQATLGETCTPGAGDCAYFLGRVNDELASVDGAMKADAQGPGHFKEPLAWLATLRATLKGDTSTANLEKHRSELIGTRDRINTWMQGHPEDYR